MIKALGCEGLGSGRRAPKDFPAGWFGIVRGDEGPFMIYYQGECTHCHKLNAESGEWSIPSAPGL